MRRRRRRNPHIVREKVRPGRLRVRSIFDEDIDDDEFYLVAGESKETDGPG